MNKVTEEQVAQISEEVKDKTEVSTDELIHELSRTDDNEESY